MNERDEIDLPKYKCNKIVHALLILKTETFKADGYFLLNGGSDYELILNIEYYEKHKPETGGYYVLYEDGYESYSPKKAFEDGYTLIEENT